ncbi:hypothetical protein RM652_14340 [Mammaliicoccus sciuri]|uniref:hypothetical protein n=1 Tax=Mammaliicoccus sciuri TaxID=1296 RepID=UPI002885995D|nr:hypothetical protein [Mammaliicoccus sciuri]MDT0704303.1 hypothetical protein [Mammaliicoccus sciuri]
MHDPKDGCVVEETEEVEQEKQTLKSDRDNYIFSRKLNSGMGLNHELEEIVYVPEKIVRQLNLNHGEVFRCERNGLKGGKDFFEKLNEAPMNHEIEPSHIVEYDYVVVSYDNNLKQFVCKEQYGDEGLKVIPTWLVHGHDATKFKLQDGDIVSAARMYDKNLLRIRWKYNTDEILPTPKPKKPTEYKDKTNKAPFEESDSLKGKNIGIFGTETFIYGYIREVEKQGVQVIHTDSDDRSHIENVFNQSDINVIPILQTSHTKAELAKEGAKLSGKPYIILKTNGNTTFINEIKNIVEEMPIHASN